MITEFSFQPPVNLHETVDATIVDAATGEVRRFVSGHRLSIEQQVKDGEVLVERVIARGKRWDADAQAEVELPIPDPPSDDAVEFDTARFRWVSRVEKNAGSQSQIERLERAQNRTVREYVLGTLTLAQARNRLQVIDDAIAALRAQLI